MDLNLKNFQLLYIKAMDFLGTYTEAGLAINESRCFTKFLNGVAFSEVFAVGFTTLCSNS